ncbi:MULTISPECIES: hypothetical protein [unclassified Massilia]|uniref:IS1096 element passenger TnpR family protein n=1 Tax=unclassified Massilia TaxID=2609279 RepID=UPI00177F24A6|nr:MULTISPECIES: hypothetical protein [unclassified Massilia]MBD8529542.1 hypothetical protein [Massilia sp. CFBP 13647]MBD8673371.1 hypothetical protein [Massilia sp. CFBP 13721]
MDKIFTLSISCIAGAYLSQAYRFELALAAESTLDELASYILDVVDFEGDHLSSFHLANGPGGRRTWLTARGAWDEDDEEARDLRLCDLYPLEKHKKLYYDYDPGARWCFEIVRKGRATNAVAGQDYPCLLREEGVKPLEYGADGVDGF